MKTQLKEKKIVQNKEKRAWRQFLLDDYTNKSKILKRRKAMEMMLLYHKGQTRLSGFPYILHPLDVASKYAKLFGENEGIVVALLHDVLEDGPENTGKRREDILKEIKKVFGWGIAKKILALTNREGKPYGEGLKEYSIKEKDLIPFKVKFCDVWSNVQDMRYVKDKEKRKRMAIKYLNLFNQFEHIFSTFPNYKAIKALIIQEIHYKANVKTQC